MFSKERINLLSLSSNPSGGGGGAYLCKCSQWLAMSRDMLSWNRKV